MDNQSLLIYIGCIIFIFIIGKIFIVPIKYIGKIILNSVLGGVLIYGLNFIGSFINIHIGVNVITSLIVGLLGIPGVIMLTVLNCFF